MKGAWPTHGAVCVDIVAISWRGREYCRGNITALISPWLAIIVHADGNSFSATRDHSVGPPVATDC
jgi:hypothetical protein